MTLNPFADPTPLTVCPKCGSTEYRDREIHNGQSQMRECAYCGYSMGVPLWLGIAHWPTPTGAPHWPAAAPIQSGEAAPQLMTNEEPTASGGLFDRLP